MSEKKLSLDIYVLGKCKILIDILKLCSLNELNDILLNKYIPLYIVLMMSVAFVMVSLFWFFLDHGFVLSKISYAIPIFIGCSQILLESFPLIMKSGRINETVNRLESVVRTRKFPLINFNFSRLRFKSFFFSGCEKSLNAYAIYEKCEQENIFIATVLFKSVVTALIVMFSINSLLPISYWLIGFPSPELWILPFPAQLIFFH